MTFKINDSTTYTLISSFSMQQTTSMVNIDISYNSQDMSVLPSSFTFSLFNDSGITLFSGKVTDYSKNVANNTTLRVRIPKI